MLKKKQIREAEIPTASQADLAFLLLLFFLVSTVIDVDTGLGLTLPEYVPPEEQVMVKVDPDRMAAVLVNEQGDVLIDGEIVSLFQIKNMIKPRIMSKVDLPMNKKLIVSLKTDRKTVYNQYIAALDQIKLAFFEARDEVSESRFGRKFKDLSTEQQEVVKDAVPIIISLAEPEQVK
ncbi:MAG: biopolymer transporter ExbD [Ignavibacterium album]|jgi:biopolymer transport protein ExbD|uniref:Biopolymer transporter ExbD n=1 Tax=Ignavibacterium album TaxID=591197 RepID=A0A7V2ZJX6_9BACT|nr:biopolymer transporter ExbD [Ignavibacterium album]MCX8105381.1 biopolymer transporter ExbD [Ignavibacterium album]